MVPFAFLIRWAYSTKAYRLENDNSGNMKLDDEDSETGDSNELLSIPAISRKHWQTQRITYQGGRWGINAWAAYINPLELIGDSMAMYKLLRDVRIRKQTMIAAPESTEEVSNRTRDQHLETGSLHPTPQERPNNDGYSPLRNHPHQIGQLTAASNYGQSTLQ